MIKEGRVLTQDTATVSLHRDELKGFTLRGYIKGFRKTRHTHVGQVCKNEKKAFLLCLLS